MAALVSPTRAADAALPSPACGGGFWDGAPTCRLEQIAADAEIHRYALKRAEEWVPAFAGT